MTVPTQQEAQASPHSGVGPAAGSASRDLDPDSRAWLSRLRSSGPVRDRALAELHELLLGAARFTLSRRASQLGREGFDDLAVQAADDALVALLARLDDYRGESRFTTWAWKFAFYEASVAVRKRSWLGREVPVEREGWDSLAREEPPHDRVEQAELLAALKSAAERALTPHQRTVFAALALNHVPVDVLAERLGTTRGALYKTLHEARTRLRGELAAAGLGPDAWQR
jgi:RNA polymerase sigma-70 factor (ECF subfamily)